MENWVSNVTWNSWTHIYILVKAWRNNASEMYIRLIIHNSFNWLMRERHPLVDNVQCVSFGWQRSRIRGTLMLCDRISLLIWCYISQSGRGEMTYLPCLAWRSGLTKAVMPLLTFIWTLEVWRSTSEGIGLDHDSSKGKLFAKMKDPINVKEGGDCQMEGSIKGWRWVFCMILKTK